MSLKIGTFAAAIAMTALSLGGCYESSDSTADIPDGDTEREITPEPLAEFRPDLYEDPDIISEEVVPDIDADEPDVCTPEQMCFSDFPCRFMSICIDESTLQECRDVACFETCGTTCCSGASCGEVEGGTQGCSEGTVCLEKVEGSGFDSGQAACLPPPTDASTEADVDYDAWHRPEAYQTWCH